MAIRQLLRNTRQPAAGPSVGKRAALGHIDAARTAESATRLIIALLLAFGRILGSLSPFSVGFVAASGWRIPGLFALIGSILGYVFSGTLTWSLKYISISALVYVTAASFRSSKIIAKGWFMPVAAGAVTAIVSSAYSLSAEISVTSVFTLLTDIALVFGGAYFYRLAFSPWAGRLGLTRSGEIPHTVSVLFLASTLIIAFSGVELFGFISIGRVLAVMAVLLLAYRGGAGAGCISGVAFGLAMDASLGGAPFFIAAYGICGLISGIFAKRSRLLFTLIYIILDAAIAAVSLDSVFVPAVLYEVFIASVLFMMVPHSLAVRLDALLPSASEKRGVVQSKEYIRARLELASDAFRDLYETVKSAAGLEKSDENIGSVFDAAAEVTCRKCAKSGKCWHSSYFGTLDAINNASAPMMERGRLERSDFPDYFASSCQNLPDFIAAVNSELRALLYRRQYRSKLQASREAVYAQYSDISDILKNYSHELSSGIEVDSNLEERLQKYIKSEGISADTAVFRLPGGRLRAEIAGGDTQRLTDTDGYLELLSAVLGVRLCTPEVSGSSRSVVLLEAEPLSAAVGIACLNRHGQKSGGDKGAYFKTDEGMLYVILSDGMGTGGGAAKYSSDAVRILERFIRSGIRTETAVKLLGDMMLLKNEDDTGCATVDLISIDLFSGEAVMYKYGAAASYLLQGGQVKRIKGGSFAAGLGISPYDMPDCIKMDLKAGSVAIMVSDGVTGGIDDKWLTDLVEKNTSETPRELARLIIRQAADKFGSEDDMTAFVINMAERK